MLILKNPHCPTCGQEIPIKKSVENELEKAAKKAARTGNRKDLQEYLKLRRNYL